MNGNDIGRILEEHRIRMIRATGIVCECGLEFETEERHRKHVADRLRTWANGEHGIEYLRRLIARILFLHPWGDGTTVDGGVKCPCGHASDDMPGHHRHVCEELADAIIDTEKEWNRKCTEPRIEETSACITSSER